MDNEKIIVQCEGFIYRTPTDLQLEIARKRCPWLFEPEKIIDLRKEES